MKLSLEIVFLGWCIKLGWWIKSNLLDLFTVTCPWLLTVIINSGWAGTGSTTGLTSADIRKSRTLVWFPNPLATEVRWGPCAGEHLTNTPLLSQWKIPSEMEVEPRYELFMLFTLLPLLTLFFTVHSFGAKRLLCLYIIIWLYRFKGLGGNGVH